MTQKDKKLIVLVGPTGVGKTAMAIKLAKQYRTQIISADSRQFYKELNIGTAKPEQKDLQEVLHHFINNLSIHERYSAGRYEAEVLETLKSVFKDSDKVIMAGGSGLFIKAVCEGIDPMVEVDLNVRASLNKRLEDNGLEALREELKILDPIYYNEVDLKNPQRILRALEVCISCGKPFSSFRKNIRAKRDFSIIKIGLHREKKELYPDLDKRVEEMMVKGLLEEVKALLPYKDLPVLQTVGYSELFTYLEGKESLEDSVDLIKRNTRRYAKRQMTWFSKDKEVQWFLPDAYNDIVSHIESSNSVS